MGFAQSNKTYNWKDAPRMMETSLLNTLIAQSFNSFRQLVKNGASAGKRPGKIAKGEAGGRLVLGDGGDDD